MAHVERSWQLSSVAFLLFAELVGGADWSNCGISDDVVMHFPDPHGKGFPTQLSLTDWGGDSTSPLGGTESLDLNGMVFSGRKPYIDGLAGDLTVPWWNGYPQYYSTKQIPGTNAWFALRRSDNGHLLLQRTDLHTSEGDANSYVGINLSPSTTELPSGMAGETWKYSPGNPVLNGLPSSQFDVTIRLDCCKVTYAPYGGEMEIGFSRSINRVTWDTPGPWSDARGLGSTCGLDANGFPNGVRKRLVQCGGHPDCQTCAYTDETDTKPATRDVDFYACTTVALTASTPCPNVPHTITARTKTSCSAQDRQPSASSAAAVAVPVVLLLLLTIVIIVYALRRQQEKAQQNQFFQPAAPTRRTSARTNSKDELEQNEALEMTDNPLSTANRRIPTDTGTASTADGGGLGLAGAEGSDGYLVVHQSGGDIYTYAPPAGESAGAPVVQYAVPLDPNDRGGAEATYQVPALRPAFVGAADGNVQTFTPSTRPVPAEVYSAPSSGGYGQAVAAATSTPFTRTNDGRKTPAASGAVDTPGAVYLVPSELAAIRSGDGGDGGASGGVDSKTIHSTAASVKLVPGAESSNADGNSNAIIYAVPVEDAPSASHHLHVARTPNILYAPFDPDAPEGIPGGVQRFPNPLYNSADAENNAPNQQRGQAEEQAAVSFQTSGVPANNQVYAQPLNAASATGVAGSADADTYTGYEVPADPALDAERPDHNNTYDQWGAQAASVTDALTASSEL
eukprot:gene5481-10938_t